ncbi:hypothetical protein, conserved [Plasmodium gonderi]|uniref:Nicalin n=1 Tax=Plasmodium gonderi TaxID=77519 RepID=A0A1Y1JDI8_PLAGO|nr:hypothetical protein, conserved [Plasmodium gonderi]GAW80556.1 hypothetical protein, conserved [Plasmodium gonderi]
MKIYSRSIQVLFPIFTALLLIFKYELVRGVHETKGYPFVHLVDSNNVHIGTNNYVAKGNLINILYLYKEITFEGDNLTIDNLVDIEDETRIERLIKEKIEFISKYVNTRQIIKYHGVIYLYEIVHAKNFYFLLHFILKNSSNCVVIIVPEHLQIDKEEYFRINKITHAGELKKNDHINDEVLEKRILFIQGLLLNFKLKQPIYFIKNNKEIEHIYENYKGNFGLFDLTRNISIVPVSKNHHRNKIASKNIFYFLSKDNINIHSIFNKKENNETFLFTKRKTIIIAVDYNVFSVISSHPSHSTSTNSHIIVMMELIKLFSNVYEKEDVNYNMLFLFTNYYFGIDNFLDSVNVIFKENIDFVMCLDNLNDASFYIHQSDKVQPDHLLRFYDLLKGVMKNNHGKEIQTTTEKIKIYNQHLPKLHEYFELKNVHTFTLSTKGKTSTFLSKTPMIEQKIKADNVSKNTKSIFEVIYLYLKNFKEENIDEKEIYNNILIYTNQMMRNDNLSRLNESLNKFIKFFVYQDEIEKFVNHIKITINSHVVTDSKFLITDYKIPNHKKQKYFYQKNVIITFSMAISYIFHYLHFLMVALFLALFYILVNFYAVPSFYKTKAKTT